MYARASAWNHGSVGRYTGVRHAAKIDALRFERARGDAQELRHYLAEGGAHRIEADAELWRVLARDPDQRRAGFWVGGMGFAAATSRIDELRTGDIAALDDSLKVSAGNSAKVDDELFLLTRISGFAKSYRFYLAHGFIHAIEVRRTLLPEAAYYEAKGSDDVIELGNFVTEFPDSPHAAENAALVRSKIADRERGR